MVDICQISARVQHRMKPYLLLGLVLAPLLLPSSALANDKATCVAAASKGQRFKDTHKLVEAREQLRACAEVRCPAVVQADCTTWLAEVEAALPGVVVTAKSGAGVDLVDVKVSVDGKLLLSKLDGTSVAMNAGPHQFHFEEADGDGVSRSAGGRSRGEKNQAVAVVLLGPVPPPKVVAPIVETATTPAPAPTAAPASTSGPWKTAGWVVGGAGIAGLGVGVVFGIIASGDKSSAHCDANNVCDPGTVSGIKSAALLSDVGWIAGGVLLAGGAALVLFAPGRSHESMTGFRIAPVFTANGGGIVAGGAW